MHRLERTAGHVAAAAAAPSRQFVIAEVPNGALEPRHFALEPAEPAALGDGAVRVKVEALTIGAGQRAGLQGSAGYAGAVKGESNAVMTVTPSRMIPSPHPPDPASRDHVCQKRRAPALAWSWRATTRLSPRATP